MRIKEHQKIIKSLQSAQVGGHDQIAAVENTPMGVDATPMTWTKDEIEW